MNADFDRFAATYQNDLDNVVRVAGENSGYFALYKARYVARLLKEQSNAKILDFGCGIGVIAGHIKRLLPTAIVHGFDPSLESIQRVDPPLSQSGVFTSEPAQLANDYDLVLLANVLHHVEPTERATFVKRLRERVKKGGRVLVIEHNPLNPASRWVVKTCVFDRGVVMVKAGDCERYFREAGFRIRRRDYVVFFPRFLSLFRFVEPWLSWFPLGAQFALTAERAD